MKVFWNKMGNKYLSNIKREILEVKFCDEK